jgi:hypothetical protein
VTLVVGRLDRAPGPQTLGFKGSLVVPAGGAAIDPVGRGLRLRIADAVGAVIVDEVLAPGAFSADGRRGWKAAGKPPGTFTYRDPAGGRGGITKAVVRDRSTKSPGRVDVAIMGTGGYRPPHAGTFAVTIELNPLGAPAGGDPGVDQCGEARFVAEEPPCRIARGTLRCGAR